MLELKSILTHVLNGIKNKDQRYIVKDDEHVVDTKTGVTYHLYDEWVKLTHEGESVIFKENFLESEQGLIWEIKGIITPPEVSENKTKNYKAISADRRKKLSDLYENPAPLTEAMPIAEEGAETYQG